MPTTGKRVGSRIKSELLQAVNRFNVTRNPDITISLTSETVAFTYSNSNKSINQYQRNLLHLNCNTTQYLRKRRLGKRNLKLRPTTVPLLPSAPCHCAAAAIVSRWSESEKGRPKRVSCTDDGGTVGSGNAVGLRGPKKEERN